MRKFGQITMDDWRNKKLMKLPAATFKVAMYLLTGPHHNSIGCYRIPIEYISSDLFLKRRTVVKAVDQLVEILFLKYDWDSQYVYIPDFWSTRGSPNVNILSCATREEAQIDESVPFKQEVSLQIAETIEATSDGVQTAFKRRSKYGDGEGDGKGNRDRDGDGDRDRHADARKSRAALPPLSFPDSLPSFQCKDGTLTISIGMVDQWRSKYPCLDIPKKLHRYGVNLVDRIPAWHKRTTLEKFEEYFATDNAEAMRAQKAKEGKPSEQKP